MELEIKNVPLFTSHQNVFLLTRNEDAKRLKLRAVNIKKCYDEVGFPMFENFCYFPFFTPKQEKDWKVKMPEE